VAQFAATAEPLGRRTLADGALEQPIAKLGRELQLQSIASDSKGDFDAMHPSAWRCFDIRSQRRRGNGSNDPRKPDEKLMENGSRSSKERWDSERQAGGGECRF
jgi:hypothetical protein